MANLTSALKFQGKFQQFFSVTDNATVIQSKSYDRISMACSTNDVCAVASDEMDPAPANLSRTNPSPRRGGAMRSVLRRKPDIPHWSWAGPSNASEKLWSGKVWEGLGRSGEVWGGLGFLGNGKRKANRTAMK